MADPDGEFYNEQENDSLLPAVPDIPVEEGDAGLYQQAARGRIVAFPVAMGLIGLGILLLAAPQIDNFDVTLPTVALIFFATFILTNLFRFFASGRRERGLFFLALVILLLGAVLALMSFSGGQFPPDQWWPLVFLGIAAALLMTYLFEQQHDPGLVRLALLILLAGGIALAVTLKVMSQNLVDQVTAYWPLLIAFLGITLIPLAMRRPME